MADAWHLPSLLCLGSDLSVVMNQTHHEQISSECELLANSHCAFPSPYIMGWLTYDAAKNQHLGSEARLWLSLAGSMFSVQWEAWCSFCRQEKCWISVPWVQHELRRRVRGSLSINPHSWNNPLDWNLISLVSTSDRAGLAKVKEWRRGNTFMPVFLLSSFVSHWSNVIKTTEKIPKL